MAHRTCLHCPAMLTDPRRKLCGSAACKRAQNTASARVHRAKWTEEQRLQARAAEKRWRDANPDRVRSKNRQNYLRDPGKYAQQRDSWRAANSDRHLQAMILQQSKRRVAKRSGDSRVVTVAEWTREVRRARGCCTYCGRKAPLTMDHVIPLARGGRHAIGNLVPACEYCNKSKGSLFVMEWRRRCALDPFGARGVSDSRLAGPGVDHREPGPSGVAGVRASGSHEGASVLRLEVL